MSLIVSSEKTRMLQELRQNCGACCKACELHKTRHNVVFSDGNPETASIVLIGEAPGKDEDMQGIPFVGRAGKLLNDYLQAAGISRENDLYIINTLKCRPFLETDNGKLKDRKPTKLEKEACKHLLFEQIKIINPKLIILCGVSAMEEFLNEGKITDIHGRIFDITISSKTYKAMPILHPSPLCRIPDKKNIMVHDLKKAKDFI